jgi:hypothetical protein
MSDGQPKRSDIRLPPTVSCAAVGDDKAVGGVCFYCSVLISQVFIFRLTTSMNLSM